MQDILIPAGGVTVAVVDSEIVGMLAVGCDASAGWIEHLYVEPAFCGAGIGSQLLRQALARLLRPIRLYTFRDNKRARRFYERFGFVLIDSSDGSDNQEQCPDTRYELR